MANPNCPTCGHETESIWYCPHPDPGSDESDHVRVGYACENWSMAGEKDHFYETYDHPELITDPKGTFFCKRWGDVRWPKPICPTCAYEFSKWEIKNATDLNCPNCGDEFPCPYCGNHVKYTATPDPPKTIFHITCYQCWIDITVRV